MTINMSPSARKVWIEISDRRLKDNIEDVTFRKEGVDWNVCSSLIAVVFALSPSARKVWIEIANVCTTFPTVFRHLPQGRCGLKCSISSHVNSRFTSPSARKVWIEIYGVLTAININGSPSARKVWIEISSSKGASVRFNVTFRKEGVDWNKWQRGN